MGESQSGVRIPGSALGCKSLARTLPPRLPLTCTSGYVPWGHPQSGRDTSHSHHQTQGHRGGQQDTLRAQSS